MGDFGGLAVEFDIHHRQRVEGDRMSGRLLRDQRDDGARQPLALAGKDAVGETAGRQRLAGDGAQLRDQFIEFGLRKRQPRAFDDAGDKARMGTQGEIDGLLRKGL